MAKVTGIGGVFFKSTNDHKKLAEWYRQNLGLQLEPWGGAILKWTDDKAEDHGLTVWHVAEKNTQWFSPSPSSFMINYRVDNLTEMLAELKQNGIEILKGPNPTTTENSPGSSIPTGTRSNCGNPCRRGPRTRPTEVIERKAIVTRLRARRTRRPPRRRSRG